MYDLISTLQNRDASTILIGYEKKKSAHSPKKTAKTTTLISVANKKKRTMTYNSLLATSPDGVAALTVMDTTHLVTDTKVFSQIWNKGFQLLLP